ncbi:uncharacterized protein PGTG_18085 [Puccinia graminis f. sp. tritici CRL 75-36-700-3]|uniref:Uncharacterized protein n=1 Tax=Puccinia graminis f. sp. tritici (strain CRL 75-36-700-3 / race SCCL) TaxID=418459 RepID=E3L6L3_PUCGT|nr:uncharacterized protein PGTG_18085 [Puccinia graminis f. sp. tritici CRL 75-36-700-3]EFP92188.2 hypothetical protein PGTG_18085 [Puccinia graminis f. sp. tritici CRL 75-36-700-3]
MTNVKKFSDFTAEQKFIGGHLKTVTLPEGKVEQRLAQIYPFLAKKAMFDYEDVEILVAQIVDLAEGETQDSGQCPSRPRRRHWAQFKLNDPQSNQKRISLLETVAIRLGLLMLLKLRDQKGKSLIVWTENTTTEMSACYYGRDNLS